MVSTRLRSALATALIALAIFAPRVTQAQQDVLSQWLFTGNCYDCAEAAQSDGPYWVQAILSVSNYTPGSDLLEDNFVSFHYLGSNLLSPYFVHREGAPGMDGLNNFVMLSFGAQTDEGSLGGFLSFGSDLTEIHGYFDAWDYGEEGQYWETCAPSPEEGNCWFPSDFGYNWSVRPYTPTNPVPEPATLALIATGFAMLGYRQLRRRAA